MSSASLTFANGFVDVEFKKAKTGTSAVDIEAVWRTVMSLLHIEVWVRDVGCSEFQFITTSFLPLVKRKILKELKMRRNGKCR